MLNASPMLGLSLPSWGLRPHHPQDCAGNEPERWLSSGGRSLWQTQVGKQQNGDAETPGGLVHGQAGQATPHRTSPIISGVSLTVLGTHHGWDVPSG